MNIRHDHFHVSRWRLKQQLNRTVKILLNFEEKRQFVELSQKVERTLRSIWSQSPWRKRRLFLQQTVRSGDPVTTAHGGAKPPLSHVVPTPNRQHPRVAF